MTLWVGIILAAAAGAAFVVSAAYADWTGLGLLVMGGALLFVAGIAGGLALLGAAQRGTVFADWEQSLAIGVIGLVALTLAGAALFGVGAGLVYRLAFGLVALLDAIAIAALLHVAATGAPPRWMGYAKPQRH